MALTLAYMTSRKEPHFWWFISSLRQQCRGNFHDIQIIVVDYWAQVITHHGWAGEDVSKRKHHFKTMMPDVRFLHLPPKPTPWQGPYRLTKNDYFAPANARNTALLHAQDGYIAYVDDLSVLVPTWLKAVRESCADNRITAGAFQKVNKLKVVNGKILSFEEFAPGKDSRWLELDKKGYPLGPFNCPGSWTFGCSLVAPVERFLEINGSPEDADSTGLGMEDTHLGIAMANNGHKIFYDRRMFTYESEEHHYQKPEMLRRDKKGKECVPINRVPGVPDEKGYYFVNKCKDAKRFENYFGPEGILGLRARVLAGETIPATVLPESDWLDGQPLSQL